ncbi:hypothetical protein KKA14_08415, partial [bacterium]|nr:hypothetical protein [bacterium]
VKKEIIRIVPGLYCLAKEFRRSELHPFVVAGMLRPSSHISLESALSFHGLIPEAVYQVSSVTIERSKTFHSPLGLFSFHRVPVKTLHAGVKAIELGRNTWAFMADPFRAIADLVYLRKSVSWKEDGMEFLTESMRIDLDDLCQLSLENLEAVIDVFSNKRTQDYLNGLRMEIF